MEQLNIKDYLQMNTEKPTKKSEPIDYEFSLVFDNGSDFILERTAKNGIKRQLCWIADNNLLFVRDPKTNKDKPVKTETTIKSFFGRDDTIRPITFKNDFFNNDSSSDFAYKLNSLHQEKINIKRNLVKFGYNPLRYLYRNNWATNRYQDALDTIPFNKVLKVVKMTQKYEDKLRKKDKDYDPQIDAEFLLFLCNIQDLFSPEYVDVFLEIYSNSDSRYKPDVAEYASCWKCSTFIDPIEDFNLDFKRYCTYLFVDLYSQGIAEVDSSVLRLYSDCLNMQKEVFGKVKEKYPEHLKECHDKIILIYNLNIEYFKEKHIEELNAHNKKLEYKGDKYSIVVAKTSQDLIEEGINLHHCVGSYVNRVKDGDCSIFFLRKTDEIDTSLITIEIQDDKVLQVRGLCERTMNDDERDFFNEWTKKKKLQFVSE